MNEKKIERLILDNTFVGRVASFTEEHPDGELAVRGAGEAARAIAEKIREAEEEASGESLIRLESLLKEAEKNVVWEGSGKMNAHRAIELLSPASGEVYGMFSPWPPGKLLDTPIHQRVRVTVTKEEGDGQGNE